MYFSKTIEIFDAEKAQKVLRPYFQRLLFRVSSLKYRFQDEQKILCNFIVESLVVISIYRNLF